MNWLAQIALRLRKALNQPLDPTAIGKRANPVYFLRLILHIGRQWVKDRCPQQAALLAFQTILSLVPLTAVSFGLFYATNLLSARSALIKFVSDHVLPVSGDVATQYLLQFAENIRHGALGPAGLLTTLLLAYLLFHTLEGIFNDIWRVRNRRTLFGKIIIFYPLATLTPPLMGVTLYYAATFIHQSGVVGLGTSILASFIALLLANKLLPTAFVSWRATAFGAIVSAILFEIAKFAFQLYVKYVALSSFQGIYGTLGLILIILIWIYYTWLVVLFGAEIAYTIQNLARLEKAELSRIQQATSPDEMHLKFNGRTAACLLAAVAKNFAHGKSVLPKEDLAHDFQLPVELVERIFSRLESGNLAVEAKGKVSGYIPAKPLSKLHVGDVLDLFNEETLGPKENPSLTKLYALLETQRQKLLLDITFDNLINKNME